MSESQATLRDRYTLGRRLGGSAASATYLATDAETGNPCVVKVLSVRGVVRDAKGAASYDPDDFTKLIELFEREARVLAHLDHPGVPRLIDHFSETVDGDTRLYTVQEHVPGETLQALVRGGRHFTEDEARDVCRQLAELLRYLHGRSPPLIHRDIKPSNVILDADGTVHLVDFGSVRDALGGGLDGKTIVGTYGYMPVEQYEARAVPQSDFYALGMTLVFMLSHREPTELPRSGMSLRFRDHVNVSDDFADVIERMIEPAPEDRYESAQALLDHLAGRVLIGPPRAMAVARPVRWGRWAALAATLVGAAALIARMFGMMGMHATAEAPMEASFRPAARTSGSQPETLVTPVDGVLAIDLDRQFRYLPEGFPMGLAAGETALPPLVEWAPDGLVVPESLGPGPVGYSYFSLGNGPDPRVDFALTYGAERWSLLVDEDNDGDLTDERPHYNQGSGRMAADVSMDVAIRDASGEEWARPYNVWVWFDLPPEGPPRGRFYARNHYAGRVAVHGRTYQAVAFEARDHDALYLDAGLCIDLDGNDACTDTERFHDGDTVPFEGGSVRLALDYP